MTSRRRSFASSVVVTLSLGGCGSVPFSNPPTPGCTKDVDCESGVCAESSGFCLASFQTLFVSPTGIDDTCSRTEPCATIGYALTHVIGSRTTIALAAGTYRETIELTDRDITISGPSTEPTATIAYVPGASHPIISVTGGHVNFEGIQLDGGGESSFAMLLTDTTATLDRVAIHDAPFGGLSSTWGLEATHCQLYLNGIGANISQSSITSSIIHDNGVGIRLRDNAQIKNSLLYENGTSVDMTGSTADFVTIARTTNAVIGDATSTVSNSIIDSGSLQPVTYRYDLVAPQLATPTGFNNIAGDPAFRNEIVNDFHLTKASMANDRADPWTEESQDLEGMVPGDERTDVGAYED